MVEAWVLVMTIGLSSIIGGAVVLAMKFGEWIGDMFYHDEPEEPDDETIEDRTRRAA